MKYFEKTSAETSENVGAGLGGAAAITRAAVGFAAARKGIKSPYKASLGVNAAIQGGGYALGRSAGPMTDAELKKQNKRGVSNIVFGALGVPQYRKGRRTATKNAKNAKSVENVENNE